MSNPFDAARDPDRHAIWQALIVEDSEAFLAGDFARIESGFDAAEFEGIRCFGSNNPDDWKIVFSDLKAYRVAWEESSRQFLGLRFAHVSHREALYSRCSLTQIDIVGERALAHKKFSGEILLADGTAYAPGKRQTIYRMKKTGEGWKVTGFLGMLPWS